jgi:hypothetical protein
MVPCRRCQRTSHDGECGDCRKNRRNQEAVLSQGCHRGTTSWLHKVRDKEWLDERERRTAFMEVQAELGLPLF